MLIFVDVQPDISYAHAQRAEAIHLHHVSEGILPQLRSQEGNVNWSKWNIASNKHNYGGQSYIKKTNKYFFQICKAHQKASPSTSPSSSAISNSYIFADPSSAISNFGKFNQPNRIQQSESKLDSLSTTQTASNGPRAGEFDDYKTQHTFCPTSNGRYTAVYDVPESSLYHRENITASITSLDNTERKRRQLQDNW